jgi:hypothetical protein
MKTANLLTVLLFISMLLSVFSCTTETKYTEIVVENFAESFDGALGEGWSWLRENPDAWRIADGALEIHVQPGKANDVKNALLRTAPDRSKGSFCIDVTVSNHTFPTQQYEQVGITWYKNDKPVFKLVKELIDGAVYIIPGKVPISSNVVQLRLIVTESTFKAKFRENAEGEFQTAAEGELPTPKNDNVSIQCYNGPPDAEHWIRFDDFVITKIE